jgi:RNA polymerase sigma-32 factor
MQNDTFDVLNTKIENTTGLIVKSYSEKEKITEYIKKINRFPVLTEIMEKELLIDFFENKNPKAGHLILNSHLRLVVKIAMQYRRFHASLMDLIAEGNLGLLKALKNFSIAKQVRFSTYAILWVKASIQNFLTNSVTSIKAITTTTQKKLLFNLSKAKKYLNLEGNDFTTLETDEKLSNILGVSSEEIRKHEKMMFETKQFSINDVMHSDEGSPSERGDFISSGEATTEEAFIEKNNRTNLKQTLANAISKLSEREGEILKYRILKSEKYTLAQLSAKLNISKERIRQIQENALKKLKEILKNEQLV